MTEKKFWNSFPLLFEHANLHLNYVLEMLKRYVSKFLFECTHVYKFLFIILFLVFFFFFNIFRINQTKS